MNSKLSIIILNWNGSHDTIECIDSLFLSEETEFNLIIIDNGSSSDDYTKLDNYCKGKFLIINFIAGSEVFRKKIDNLYFKNKVVTIIGNEENLGFAIGSNRGIEFSLNNGADTILLLNNDTLVTPHFLTEMVDRYEEEPTIGAVIPQIRYFDKKDCIWNCGGKIFMGFRKYYFENSKITDLPKTDKLTVTFATGCAILFKPRDVGLLTEKFFFGEEDFEFAYRMKRMKKKMICAMNSVIYHKVGRSINNNFGANDNFGKLFIHYLNRFINMKQQFNNKIIWQIWRFIYSIYIIYNLIFIMNFRESLVFMKVLWQKSDKLSSVDKNCFDWAFKTWKRN